ncbi:hypothetical protein BGX23_002850 [Mortierella sp. AD031]|nr:hypothetical protein BGX23_002850 [Mortierella sp. AD031]
MTDNRLTLFCLVDGESTSNAFPLAIPSTETVGELKELIKTKKLVDFENADTNNLTLWSVSNPDDDDDDEIPILFDNRPEKKTEGDHQALQTHAPVSVRGSSSLSDHLSDDSRPGSPISDALKADLTRIATRFFAVGSESATFLERFAQGHGDLSLIDGGISGLPIVGKRRLKKFRTAPSLMFFDLPSPTQSDLTHNQAEKILADYPGTRHLPLFGISGSGKTRTAIDLLSRSWGFYFNAGLKDLGSDDIHSIVTTITAYDSIYLTPDKARNSSRVHYLTFGLLCARLLILDFCLRASHSSKIFSFATPAFKDVFQILFRDIGCCIRNYASQDLFDEVQQRLVDRDTHLPKFLITMDEVQVLSRIHKDMYLDSDSTTPRPVLAPILFAPRHVINDSALDKSGGSVGGAKLTNEEYHNDELGHGGFFAIRVAIICTIEDIIEADNPSTWEECIRKREDRLTTAFIPTTDGEHRRLKGNLCGQLRRMFLQGRHEQDNLAFAEFRNVEAMLKVAIATFMTQGGHLAFKGQLPRLVETAFGRIKIIDGEYHTTIDESFALWAADNYFQMTDPDYVQYRCDQLGRSSTEATRGKDWEFSIPNEMAPIVGWSGSMRTTDFMEITMAEFLDAHINNNNSERNGEFVPPFFYLGEQVSGPDIVFVLRFIGLALGGTVDSSLTLSPGSTSSDIICPVFVQVKLCKELLETKVIDARRTVQPAKIRNHGVNIAQYCRSHGHYINLIVSYPAEISSYFMDKPAMKKHSNNLTEVALTIDDSNIDLFSEKHFQALRHKKRLATDMAETTEAVKRFRGQQFSSDK